MVPALAGAYAACVMAPVMLASMLQLSGDMQATAVPNHRQG